MKEIARFHDQAEAHLALHWLRSEGLNVSLADYQSSAYVFGGNGGIRLLASSRDAYQAKTLLAQRKPRSKFPTCPNCGSRKARRIRDTTPLLAALADFVAIFQEPSRYGSFECKSCGQTWETIKDEPSDDV
ncbi:MAG: DUF2007 domain-containing protein [Pseudomonadota bacterium]